MAIENGVQYHEAGKFKVSNENSSFILKRKFKFYYLKRKNVPGTCHCCMTMRRCSVCMQPGTQTRTSQL